MNRNYLIIGILSVTIISLVFVLIVDSLIIGLVFVIPLLYIILFYLRPVVLKINNNNLKLDELYTLVNTTLAQLKVDKTLNIAFKNVANYWPENLKATYATFELNTEEFLAMMSSYFNNGYFELFKNIIKLFDTKGGEINERASSLVNAIAFSKLMLNEILKVKYRKLSEFFVMWLLAFFILIYMRVGLVSYYLKLLDTNFLFAVLGVISIFLISSYFAIKTLTEIEVDII